MGESSSPDHPPKAEWPHRVSKSKTNHYSFLIPLIKEERHYHRSLSSFRNQQKCTQRTRLVHNYSLLKLDKTFFCHTFIFHSRLVWRDRTASGLCPKASPSLYTTVSNNTNMAPSYTLPIGINGLDFSFPCSSSSSAMVCAGT